MESAYVQLIRAGIQPSEIWNMTWPEYMILCIAAREDECNNPSAPSADQANIIRCDSFDDFAAVLAGTRGRIE